MRNIKAIKYARKTNKNNKEKKIKTEIRDYAQNIYKGNIYSGNNKEKRKAYYEKK